MSVIPRALSITREAASRREQHPTSNARTYAVVLLSLLSLSASSFAETAYSALRVVEAERGEEIFTRVLGVRGNGTQEPAIWKILLADPEARSGVKEVEVRNGRIVREGAPKKAREASTPIDFEALNLDSDGVLAVINQEDATAVRAERITYALANGAASGKPVWTIKLHRRGAAEVTLMEIAADTGELLTKPVAPATDDAESLSEANPGGQPVPLDPALAEERDPGVKGEGNVRRKQAAPRFRENGAEVPALARSLVKRAGKPVRMLRRFLP